ncbi:hypothetical protein C3L33_06121, partial [Rhododendron williamsianum]
MGIQGLLPLLKSIMVPTHIKDLEGCSVAVDTYSWLHKGALSCSKDLCKGQPTSKHIDYCMHRVNLLRHYGVRPILVFDGGLLPMKSEQEIKRARARKENLARAIEHETNGNNSAAYDCYQKAVDISPSVAYELIQADAQMTFLAVSKQVDAVITEDSDLIAFGCPRIIYKMDKFGQGVEFRYSKLQQNKELNFTGFTKQMLLEMCILSGCDYLLSLPGMGLKKAHALMKKFGSYDKVIKHLKYSTVAVPPSYEDSFRKAMMTFQHQRVYDPMVEDIAHLSDLPDDVGDDLDFLGFASLEAKRRFTVPRSNSKHPNPPNENSSTAEQVNSSDGTNLLKGVNLQVTDHDRKPVSDAGEGKMRKENIKNIMRSSYFQYKVTKGDDEENDKEDVLTDDCEDMTPEHECKSASDAGNAKTRAENRKTITRSRIIFTPEDTITETEASGGKFGCNISHLENYSDIADKSIERFVSVISSFRCSSSGSRASGLRAPLKDVRNTCTIRSNSAVDFGDFAFVPTKRKTSSVHRRG